MKITWAENPLETRVDLDESDKRFLRERIRVDYLENRIFSACYELNPGYQPQITAEERAARTFKMLDVGYILDDEPRNGKSLTQWLDEQVVNYVKELLEAHVGDCTCFPCSCLKCHAESILGIDTISGLGKHSAHKINASFSGSVSIHEAVRRLENYQPTYDPNSTWSRDDWEKHVPRWMEEGKRAYAWLVTYRDEHFPRVEQ